MAKPLNGLPGSLQAVLRLVETHDDAELLHRYRDERDGEAFASIVRRHGPMVLAVCRRVLRDSGDAEDAFQATFLVLARRAASIRSGSPLANWLYGVAYRTAMEARRAAAVRRVRERRAAEMKPAALDGGNPEPDLTELLDRELNGLPEIYRAAIVVCDLEGLPRKLAAAKLGWSEGTLSGRLSRARALLARRMSRHGLSVSAGLLATTLANSGTAGVPQLLLEVTSRIGSRVAMGEAASAIASAPVLILMEGVMKGMLLTKLKVVTAAVLMSCAVLMTSSASWQANSAIAGDPLVAKAAAPETNPDKLRIAELERERDRLLKQIKWLENRVEWLEGRIKTSQSEGTKALMEASTEAIRRVQINPATPAETKSPDEPFEVIRLKHANAEEAARVVTETFNGPQQYTPVAGGGVGSGRIRVVAEKSSNSLIVVKASTLDLLTIRKLLTDVIDSPQSQSNARAVAPFTTASSSSSSSESVPTVVQPYQVELIQPQPTPAPIPQQRDIPQSSVAIMPQAISQPSATTMPQTISQPSAITTPQAISQPSVVTTPQAISQPTATTTPQPSPAAQPQPVPQASITNLPPLILPHTTNPAPTLQPDMSPPVAMTIPQAIGSYISDSDPPAAAAAHPKPIMQSHSIRKLAGTDKEAESLIKIIRAAVEPQSWGLGLGTQIEYFAAGKSIIVLQSLENHKEIVNLLAKLAHEVDAAKQEEEEAFKEKVERAARQKDKERKLQEMLEKNQAKP